jgi:hypothetical protein
LAFEDLTLPTIHFYEIKLRDAATGRLAATIDWSARGRGPDSMTFSPDSKTLVVKYFPADFKGRSSRNEDDRLVGRAVGCSSRLAEQWNPLADARPDGGFRGARRSLA